MAKDAARALGRSVGHYDDAVPGVSGSQDIVDALIEGYVASKSPGPGASCQCNVATSSMSWKS